MSSPLQNNITNLQSVLDTINNLPEAGSGSIGGSQVQVDYAQNDSSAVDYIKNRPCYVEEDVILFDQDITMSLSDDADAMPLVMYEHPSCIINTNNFKTGDIFDIIVDGITYSCEYSAEDKMVGNFFIIIETFAEIYDMTIEQVQQAFGTNITDTGEPFLIGFEDGVTNNTMFATREEGTYHYTVVTDIVHKLDNKFLPEVDALPSVTTADNDKVLMVVNGEWSVASIADGDEVAY